MELRYIKTKTEKALEKAQEAYEEIYDALMDAYEYEEYEEDGITRFCENLYISGQKCAVSYRDKSLMGSEAGEQGGIYMAVSREMKLYLPPDVNLKKGSKVVITKDGKSVCYKNSGEAAVYTTHQEIGIILWERWG